MVSSGARRGMRPLNVDAQLPLSSFKDRREVRGNAGSGLDGRRGVGSEPVRLHPPALRSECLDCSTAARHLSTGQPTT
jgi:hypothetical protein